MKRLLCLMILCLPLIMHAQEEKGIKWTTGLSWEQVKEKAKKENKYIFLDCYTTWCGPCKMMDKNVYPNDSLGQFFNINYISVRVQMDKTKNDNEEVKAWYETVKNFNERYVIEGYPTFLFFTPNAEPVVKEIGYKEPLEFMKLAAWAKVTDDRIEDVYAKYTRLLKEFKDGEIDYTQLPFMVTNAKKRGDSISRQILRVHEEYVSKMPKKRRYTKENIEFWSTLNLTSDRKIVQFFYKDGKMIDKIMNKKGYAAKELDKSIQAFTVAQFINEQLKNPEARSGVITINREGGLVSNKASYEDADWNHLYQTIKKNFNNKVAVRNLLKSKAIWYDKNSNWNAYTETALRLLELTPPEYDDWRDYGNLNDIGWNVFSFVTDKTLINRTIIWMGKLAVNKPEWSDALDTYANLLYKVGRKEEAILWQEKALSLEPSNENHQQALAQMKKGEPTYGVQPL